ncbi:Hypothetical tyrosine recombinase [Thermococcus onnurineus NA1]|uniref:Hypothetical tyrosine recombinase n=1 Tax=Thermococcus onnurineus (strain NA1) TaxID=523850 RepID=B6YXQ5_THEON|nr:site-specific integrase [Thermococcus onnurineus]ACJ16868.1 Hypothetical tyrosine recombinase [Thermococcus onnurineus NA1]
MYVQGARGLREKVLGNGVGTWRNVREHKRSIRVTWDMADDFLREYREKYEAGVIAYSTYRNVSFAITRFFEFLVEVVGVQEVYEIDRDILQHFFIWAAKKGYKRRTLEKLITYVGKLIRRIEMLQLTFLGFEFNYRAVLGGKGIKRFDSDDLDWDAPDAEDIQHTLDELHHRYERGELSELVYDRLRLIVLLGAYTGARGTEMSRIKVKHIFFEEGLLQLFRDKIENEYEKMTLVPIHPVLSRYLKYYIGKYGLSRGDLLFGSSVKTGGIDIDKYLYRYGISKMLRLRDMRKFFANTLIESGAVLSFEYLMGHSVRNNIKTISFVHYIARAKLIPIVRQEYFTAFANINFDPHLDTGLDTSGQEGAS